MFDNSFCRTRRLIWSKKGKLNVLGYSFCLTIGCFGAAGWDLFWHWENFKGSFLVDRTQLRVTQGRIIQSSGSVDTEEPRINKKRIVYNYIIRYEYSVNNQRYQATTVNFAKYPTTDISRVSKYLNKYPLDADISVYYDPSDPAFAVLEPDQTYSIAGIALVMAFGCSFLTGLLWMYYR